MVKRYSLHLMPKLFGHLNPMPNEAAAQMELDLAEDLRWAGDTVTDGYYPQFGFLEQVQTALTRNGNPP